MNAHMSIKGRVDDKTRKKRLRFNRETCICCMQCVLACNFKLDRTMGVSTLRTRIHVLADPENLKAKAEICTKCVVCTRICPTQATYFDEKDVLRIDYDRCIKGCRVCVDACPWDVLVVEGGRPVACDDCLDCVDSCEPGALTYG